MLKAAKPLVFALSLAPFLWLVFRAFTGRLTANPIEDITLTTGIWALRLLVITVAITPARRLTGWNWLVQFRRMFGLFAFFYAVLHLTIYITDVVAVEGSFTIQPVLRDIFKRPFITAGMIAFVTMIPLAMTSTRGWIRRLGRRWQLLHRLVYLSVAAAAVHYLWKVKVMYGPPVNYAILVALLLVFRAWWAWNRRSRRAPEPAARSPLRS